VSPWYVVTEDQQMVTFPAGTRVMLSEADAQPMVEAGVLRLADDRELDPSVARQAGLYRTRMMDPEDS
jgi:hypothetical protein